MSLFLLILTNLLYADVTPEFPAPDVDRVLLQNLAPRDFFSKKISTAGCAGELDAVRANYRALRRELVAMKEAKAASELLDAKEAEVFRSHDQVLKKLEACGECSTQKITNTKGWTFADGSCQLSIEDKSQLETVFQRGFEYLADVQKYAAYRDGFPSLWEFIGMNYTSGELLPNLGKLSLPSTQYVYIGVKGIANRGFHYIAKSDLKIQERNGLKEFIIIVNGVPFPDAFEPPTVYAVTAGGKKTKVSFQPPLTQVQAMWYLNSDGYIRYYTAANFGFFSSLPFAHTFARETLISTLFRQVERSLGEP